MVPSRCSKGSSIDQSAEVMENTTPPTNIETVALVVDKPGGAFELKPVVFDEVRDDEYLVEMLYSGICHTVHIPLFLQITRLASANIISGSATQRRALRRRLQIPSNLRPRRSRYSPQSRKGRSRQIDPRRRCGAPIFHKLRNMSQLSRRASGSMLELHRCQFQSYKVQRR